MGDSFDQQCMRLALELASQGEGYVEPNPMVGCVLAKDGKVVGQGFHQKFGGPHAEVNALASLESPTRAKDCTAYVTLEPCCYHGKTPPCTDALIDSGVRRVVIAMQDPFTKVQGGGIKHLRDAGIEVQVGLCQDDARELIAPYLKLIETKTPWVIAKWAMTLDGRIATIAGESKWITSEHSRKSVHQLRGRVDAIITGIGTVIADDPLLNARITDEFGKAVAPSRSATRVVLCRNRLPSIESQLVKTAKELPLFLAVSDSIARDEVKKLQDSGATIVPCPGNESEMIESLLQQLGSQNMTNVMIEGGAKLLGSFLQSQADHSKSECYLDEIHVYLGPKLFGGQQSPGPIAGSGIADVAIAPEFRLLHCESIGSDVKAIYRRATNYNAT